MSFLLFANYFKVCLFSDIPVAITARAEMSVTKP